MKQKYKKYSGLYMFYLKLHHTSILSEVFEYRKSFSRGCWNRLKRLYKRAYLNIMEKR
jgi:hypothetical protein